LPTLSHFFPNNLRPKASPHYPAIGVSVLPTLAVADGFIPELSRPPFSTTMGKWLLAIGASVAILLLIICLLQSLRKRRFNYSLRGFFAFTLALSVAVWGIVNWHQALALRKSEHWVALIDGDLVRKSDVEARMGELFNKLDAFKSEKNKAGLWNADYEGEWTKVYIESFQQAVRDILIDCVMLKQARRDGNQVDEKELNEVAAGLKFTNLKLSAEETRRLATRLCLVRDFEKRLRDKAPEPSSAEIEQYYKDNFRNFPRMRAVEYRMITLGNSPFTTLIDAMRWRETLAGLREKIVTGKISFAQAAIKNNDEEFLRKNAGLVFAPAASDGFYDEDDIPDPLWPRTRNLEVGEVSKVMEWFNGYALIFFEARRPAGIKPLEGEVLDIIRDKLRGPARTKFVQDWCRAALQRANPQQWVNDELTPLPPEFFFSE